MGGRQLMQAVVKRGRHQPQDCECGPKACKRQPAEAGKKAEEKKAPAKTVEKVAEKKTTKKKAEPEKVESEEDRMKMLDEKLGAILGDESDNKEVKDKEAK